MTGGKMSKGASTKCDYCGEVHDVIYCTDSSDAYVEEENRKSLKKGLESTICEHCKKTVVKDNYDIHMEEKHSEIENYRIHMEVEHIGDDCYCMKDESLQIPNIDCKDLTNHMFEEKDRQNSCKDTDLPEDEWCDTCKSTLQISNTRLGSNICNSCDALFDYAGHVCTTCAKNHCNAICLTNHINNTKNHTLQLPNTNRKGIICSCGQRQMYVDREGNKFTISCSEIENNPNDGLEHDTNWFMLEEEN